MDFARMPSLDLVRGFVAVGRRMSITLAAKDLHLTQSAVSRQIHALEEQLGVKLLVRGHRTIEFTPEGERLYRSADGALQQLQDVLGELQARSRNKPVTISATIGFTGLWLLPRLGKLQALYPDIDVRVAAHNRLVDLRNDGIDMAIRYTSADRAPSGAKLLFAESVVPVASPSFGAASLRSAGAVSALTLLEFDDERYPWLQWRPWLDAHVGEKGKPRTLLHFNQYDLVIQAALAGQGVALGRYELIRPMIEEGRLVVIESAKVAPTSRHGFWLIEAEPRPRQQVQQVADWIKSEAIGLSAPTPSEPEGEVHVDR